MEAPREHAAELVHSLQVWNPLFHVVAPEGAVDWRAA
jgi:hypothetical protein